MSLANITAENQKEYNKSNRAKKLIDKGIDLSKAKHIIFDIDNVLINLNSLDYKVFNESIAFSISAKFCITEEEFNEKYKNYPIVSRMLILMDKFKKTAIQKNSEQCEYNYRQGLMKYLEGLDYNVDLMLFLELLRDKYNLSFSICSNLPYEFVRGFINSYTGSIFFGMFLAQDHARYLLPNPDMYLKTFWIRNICPKDVVCVVNDKEHYNTAVDCGMKAILVNSLEDMYLKIR